jgi:hypothetical protein
MFQERIASVARRFRFNDPLVCHLTIPVYFTGGDTDTWAILDSVSISPRCTQAISFPHLLPNIRVTEAITLIPSLSGHRGYLSPLFFSSFGLTEAIIPGKRSTSAVEVVIAVYRDYHTRGRGLPGGGGGGGGAGCAPAPPPPGPPPRYDRCKYYRNILCTGALNLQRYDRWRYCQSHRDQNRSSLAHPHSVRAPTSGIPAQMGPAAPAPDEGRTPKAFAHLIRVPAFCRGDRARGDTSSSSPRTVSSAFPPVHTPPRSSPIVPSSSSSGLQIPIRS